MFPIKHMGRHTDITYPVTVILNYIVELELLGLTVTHKHSSISSSGETVDLDIKIKNADMTPDQTCAILHTKLYIGTANSSAAHTKNIGVVALELSNTDGAEQVDLVQVDLIPTAFPTMKNAKTTLAELARVVSREFDVYTFNDQMSHLHRFPGSD